MPGDARLASRSRVSQKETTMAARHVDEVAEANAAQGTRRNSESRGQRGDQRGRRLGHGPADKPGGTADIRSMPSTPGYKRRMKHGRMTHEHKHENRVHGQHQRDPESACEHRAGRRKQSIGAGDAAAKGSRWWKQEGRMKQGRMEADRRTGRGGRAQQRGEDARAQHTGSRTRSTCGSSVLPGVQLEPHEI